MAKQNLSFRRHRVAETLENDLCRDINEGRLAPGSLILSIEELSKRYNLKFPTTQKALKRLEQAGYLVTKHGSGTFVADRFKKSSLRLAIGGGSSVEDFLQERICSRGLPITIVQSNDDPEADIICSSGPARDRTEMGCFVPLETLMRPDDPLMRPDGWLAGACDRFRLGGHTYALPVYLSPVVLYYNSRMLEKAGVEVSAEPWTWSEFARIIKKLRPVCDTTHAGVMPFPDVLDYYMPFIAQNNGHLYSSDNKCALLQKETLEAIRFVRRLSSLSGGTVPEDSKDLRDRFLNGRSAFIMAGGNMSYQLLRAKPFQWGWRPLPVGKTKATILFAEGLQISAHSENRAAAWDFIRECLSEEAQRFFVDQCLPFPSRRGLVDEFVLRHGKSYARYLDECSWGNTERHNVGRRVRTALNSEMIGFLNPGLSDEGLVALCGQAARVVDRLIATAKVGGQEVFA